MLVRGLVLALALVACGSQQSTEQVGTPLSLATYPRSGGCRQAALLPVSIGREGDEIVFVSVAAPGRKVSVAWPDGFSARLVDGVAELVDPNGIIVGREGDRLDNLGGGSDDSGRFNVCSIGSVTY